MPTLLTYQVVNMVTGEVTIMRAKTARNIRRTLGQYAGRYRINLIRAAAVNIARYFTTLSTLT